MRFHLGLRYVQCPVCGLHLTVKAVGRAYLLHHTREAGVNDPCPHAEKVFRCPMVELEEVSDADA
jgi:hypothetical protein